MPTVPVYVPANVARQIASRWDLPSSDPDLTELLRSLCMESLERVAGVDHMPLPFAEECEWERLHRPGYRCRHCGGG